MNPEDYFSNCFSAKSKPPIPALPTYRRHWPINRSAWRLQGRPLTELHRSLSKAFPPATPVTVNRRSRKLKAGFHQDSLGLLGVPGGLDSQKAANLARDDRVSLTIDHDTPDLRAITACPWRPTRMR